MKFRFMVFFTVLANCALLPTVAHANSGESIDLQVIVYDEHFYQLIDRHSQVDVLADKLDWAEGPVWVDRIDALLFSDVAANKIYRWDEDNGLSVYLHPSGHAPDNRPTPWRGSNGLAIDEKGALLLAQQGNRTLARLSAPIDKPVPDYKVLASQFEGKSINSPNDLVVHRSGDIYFTDPPYGLAGFEKSPDIELDFFGVFRLTKKGELSVISRELEKPNGIALSSDDSTLYVSNSEIDKAQIIAIELDSEGKPIHSRLFFDATTLIADGPGSTDGMTNHPAGYLFVSIPNGLGILSPAGKLLGKIALGQITNMTLDNKKSYLYITSPKRLMRLKIKRLE